MTSLRARISTLALTSVLAIALTACGGDDDGTTSPDGDTTPDVSVTGTEALKFEPTELTASAGTIAIELVSAGAVEHDVHIEEAGDTLVVAAAANETAVGTIDLEAGTYTFYCAVPGHRAAGMEGTLTVS